MTASSPPSRIRIAFVHGNLLTFTKLDRDLLSGPFDVRELHYDRSSLRCLVGAMLKTFLVVPQVDVVLSWFGSYHALLPFLLGRLLGKRCLVISSGYDVAAMPEIGYGNMRPGIRRLIGRAVFALAHRVAPVSHYAAAEAQQNAGIPPDRLRVIDHGVPDLPGVDAPADSQPPLVLTVGAVTEGNLERKGMRLFVETAALLPEVPFVLAGDHADQSVATLRALATPNVRFTGRLTDEALHDLMASATVYVQVSAHEAFGMALAEAMLSGCVPVVSHQAALPEVVGDTGVYVRERTAPEVAQAIRAALALPPAARDRARQRIVGHYSLERRRTALVNWVRESVD